MKFVMGILILISLAIALFNNFELLYRLAYVMAAIIILSYFWVWSNSQQVRANIKIKGETAQVGHWLEQEIEITNTGLLPKFWLELRVNSTLPGNSKSVVVSLPHSGESKKWQPRIQCQRRGLFNVGPIVVTSHDPFGLFQRKSNLGESHSLLVYPAIMDISPLVLPHPGSQGDGSPYIDAYYTSPSFSGIREYQPTDSLKRIHWPSSTRTGQLMVKEFEAESSNNIWIIVDMESAVQAGKETDGTEELAASLAASLAKRYIESNNQVGLLTWGDNPYQVLPQKGGDQLIRIMQSLALVKAQGFVPLHQLLAWHSKLWGKDSTLIVITSSSNELWPMGLRQLMLQGAKVTVVLLDASTFDSKKDSSPVLRVLADNGVPVYPLKKGALAIPLGQVHEVAS